MAKVDPFKQGYTFNPGLIILGKLRLCFEVVLEHPTFGLILMPPIVSQIVKDRKMFGELKIVDISENKAPFEGGKKIFLFCSKVQRSDIEIHFQFGNDSNNDLVIAPDTSEVHEQYGIKFTSPKCSFSIDNTRVQARVQVKSYLLEACFDLISSPSSFMTIQIVGGKITENLRFQFLLQKVIFFVLFLLVFKFSIKICIFLFLAILEYLVLQIQTLSTCFI